MVLSRYSFGKTGSETNSSQLIRNWCPIKFSYGTRRVNFLLYKRKRIIEGEKRGLRAEKIGQCHTF